MQVNFKCQRVCDAAYGLAFSELKYGDACRILRRIQADVGS